MTHDIKDIAEIRQVTLTSTCDSSHVNKLLVAGWILLSCASSPETASADARTLYVLGRPAKVNAVAPTRAETFGVVPA